MIKRVKTLVGNNRVVIENFSFLSILQVSNLIIFFLMIPFLFRVLGKENYGVVVFAQTIAAYFSIVVNYGFNATATRDISIFRNEAGKRSEIISSVLILKLGFLITSLVLVLVLVNTIPFLKINTLVFIFSMLYCINEALFPVWYFQGIEKMKYITFLNLGTRIISAFFVFFLIEDSDDYYKVPLILGTGMVAGSIVGLVIVFRIKGNRFIMLPLSRLRGYIIVNFPLFFSNVSSQLYVHANRLVIGTYLGMTDLAIYDVAERIVNIVKVPLVVVGQVLFPKVSRDENTDFIRKAMFITLFIYALVYAFLFALASPLVILITGTPNPMAVMLIRILGLSVLPICAGLFYSELLLIPFGFLKDYARLRTGSLILYLLLLLILSLTNYTGVVQLSLTVVIVETFVFAYSYLLAYRNNLIPRLTYNNRS